MPKVLSKTHAPWKSRIRVSRWLLERLLAEHPRSGTGGETLRLTRQTTFRPLPATGLLDHYEYTRQREDHEEKRRNA